MRKLYLKMLREIKTNLGQFISIIIVIAIGSFMFSGMLTTIQSIKTGVNQYYNNQNLADAWVMFQNISEEELTDIPVGAGVQIEGRYTSNAETVVNEHDVSLLLHSITDINAVNLMQGRTPIELSECIVDSKFANANNLLPGDTVNVNNTPLNIVGIGDSPENAFKVKDSATAHVSQKTYGIIYTTEATMLQIMKNSKEYTDQLAKIMTQKNETLRNASVESLEYSIKSYQEVLLKSNQIDDTLRILEKNEKYISSIKQADYASVVAVQGGIDTISTVSYLFPVVFFLVAAIILLITMAKMVENQRTQIAILQAIGISRGRIRSSYLFYAAAACLFGSFPFAFLGAEIIPKALIKMFYNRFALGNLPVNHNKLIIIAPFVLALLCSLTAALLAVRGVLKEVPAQAMRPKPPKKSKVILIERYTRLWKKLKYSTKLICRNIFLNKLRIFLSSIGVIGSIMLMITGISLHDSANEVLKSRERGIAYDLSVVYNSPINQSEELLTEFSPSAIELTKTYHAEVMGDYSSDIAVQVLPVDSQLIRLFDLDGSLISMKENSVIIPEALADDAELMIGDSISLAIDDVIIPLTISDISVQYTSNIIYISDIEVEKTDLSLDYNTALVKLSDPDNVDSINMQLLKNDDVKAVNTKEDLYISAKENLSMLNVIILIIIAAAGMMSVTVIYNITSINIFERSREFATLMVLGYYKAEVNKLLFIENIVLSILGCIGGLPCGIILYRIIINSFSETGVMLPNKVTGVTVLITFGINLIITILTNQLMKRKLRDINMIESLKSVE